MNEHISCFSDHKHSVATTTLLNSFRLFSVNLFRNFKYKSQHSYEIKDCFTSIYVITLEIRLSIFMKYWCDFPLTFPPTNKQHNGLECLTSPLQFVLRDIIYWEMSYWQSFHFLALKWSTKQCQHRTDIVLSSTTLT